MSEDEQCGRWETTPDALKAEVQRLRTVLERTQRVLLDTGNGHTEMALGLTSALTIVSDALKHPSLRTD